ncbi:amino acid deaminase [Grimontia marina]|uniref:D-threonine aldolase n=1 Tax=Grimontia marina TaxID=646534 RepID=A0A128FFN9_9GAMM|nr:amino acid deaminase [Grimontia marina]CZF85588.1 D-threonine aldolase [Grimontia marina]
MGHSAEQPIDNFQASLQDSFPIGTKGIWAEHKDNGRYSLIEEEISLPTAVILQSAVDHNIHWMQAFADKHQVKLCPHGKTSMTPYLFKKQLEQGAWGMTIATPAQAEIAALTGAKRIIMANQLVGKANMAEVIRLQSSFDVKFYCSVDSALNVQQLSAFFAERGQQVNVFIELGVDGGRCGVRGIEAATDLARLIHQLPGTALAGVEVYEGVISGDDTETRVRQFIAETVEFARSLKDQGLIDTKEAIVTGAGSAWYDVVAETFSQYTDLLPVIRPGCYLTHDTGIYEVAQKKVMARAKKNHGIACHLDGDLKNALEVWACVVSTPEPGKALIGMGKRDASYDAGLPIAERGFRNGIPIDVTGLSATAVMDQHTFVDVPADCDLLVGDVIAFSTSHPCLTFDKWRYIALADDNYIVEHWLPTQF